MLNPKPLADASHNAIQAAFTATFLMAGFASKFGYSFSLVIISVEVADSGGDLQGTERGN